jgi:hypothetical protein
MANRYMVAGGVKSGKYLTRAVRPVGTRKYSWTNYKTKAVALTYEQARGAVRRYGGHLLAV